MYRVFGPSRSRLSSIRRVVDRDLGDCLLLVTHHADELWVDSLNPMIHIHRKDGFIRRALKVIYAKEASFSRNVAIFVLYTSSTFVSF